MGQIGVRSRRCCGGRHFGGRCFGRRCCGGRGGRHFGGRLQRRRRTYTHAHARTCNARLQESRTCLEDFRAELELVTYRACGCSSRWRFMHVVLGGPQRERCRRTPPSRLTQTFCFVHVVAWWRAHVHRVAEATSWPPPRCSPDASRRRRWSRPRHRARAPERPGLVLQLPHPPPLSLNDWVGSCERTPARESDHGTVPPTLGNVDAQQTALSDSFVYCQQYACAQAADDVSQRSNPFLT